MRSLESLHGYYKREMKRKDRVGYGYCTKDKKKLSDFICNFIYILYDLFRFDSEWEYRIERIFSRWRIKFES